MRSRVPTVRKPGLACIARLAVFSGKMPDRMVQIPAASEDRMSAVEELVSDAAAVGLRLHVDGVLDHPGVDAAVRDWGGGDPAEHRARGVGRDIAVAGKSGGAVGAELLIVRGGVHAVTSAPQTAARRREHTERIRLGQVVLLVALIVLYGLQLANGI
jgi:hypothetical protein